MRDILNKRELDIIIAIKRNESIQVAEKKLKMEKGSLSPIIRRIEKKLGVLLFERNGALIRETNFCMGLIPKISSYIDSLYALEDFVEENKKKLTGMVSVSAPTDLMYFVTRTIPEFNKVMPGTVLNLITNNNDCTTGLSVKKKYDITISYAIPDNEMLIAKKITRMKLDVYRSGNIVKPRKIKNVGDYGSCRFILLNFLGENYNTHSFYDKKQKCSIDQYVTGSYIVDNYMDGFYLAEKNNNYILGPNAIFAEMNRNILIPTLPSHIEIYKDVWMSYTEKSFLPYRVVLALEVISTLMARFINSAENRAGDAD